MKKKIINFLNADFELNKNLVSNLLKIKGIGLNFILKMLIFLKIKKSQKFDENISLELLKKTIKEKKFLNNWEKNWNEQNNSKHIIGDELIIENKINLKKIINSKSYIGLFHSKNKKVRGQRSRHNNRKNKKKIKYKE